MAIANKALVWSLFAAGGTLTAFLFPVLIFLFLAVSLGWVPAGLEYGAVHGALQNWLVKALVLVVLVLALWHAAHRMRVAFHDFGVRADGAIATGLYLLAGLGTVLTALLLASIG